ncbi:MAG: asparaginase domain-containing protein [Pseudomonadota bacterium]
MESITFVSTGGTIDKVYFDAMSQYEIGESVVSHILADALVTVPHDFVALMRKDSQDLTDADRAQIVASIEAQPARQIIVTHGTDTMTTTAEALAGIKDKVIVLTGSLTPARFHTTDAMFNIGLAVGAVQSKPAGVYIAMSGQVFDAGSVRKNRERNCFERVGDSPAGSGALSSGARE